MKTVIIESPYAGKGRWFFTKWINRRKNTKYLQACMRDCLLRGEAPFASHGLYTQPGVLRDDLPLEREHGIQAGFVWRTVADKTIVYCDRGFSSGMTYGIKDATKMNHAIEYRFLGGKLWSSTEELVTSIFFLQDHGVKTWEVNGHVVGKQNLLHDFVLNDVAETLDGTIL